MKDCVSKRVYRKYNFISNKTVFRDCHNVCWKVHKTQNNTNLFVLVKQ